MIIKGSAGGKSGHAGALARHLMRTDENARVEILELDPTAPGENLKAVLNEFQMLAATHSKGERGLYQASLNPEIDDRNLDTEEWKRAADILEARLGFENLPRVIVLHEKDQREHIHVVWQRFDIETGTLRPTSHNYRAHMEAAREIEQTLDLARFQDITSDRTYDYAHTQKSKRTDLTPPERKTLITELFTQADSAKAFVAALGEAGFDLARGDKPNTFVVIDVHGEVHALHRQIAGLKKAQIHERMLPATPDQFRSVSDIRREKDKSGRPRETLHRDDLREEIESQFAQERETIEVRHALETARLERQIAGDNQRARQEKKLARSPAVQFRRDQSRLAAQNIKRERLAKRQSNELARLRRAERSALGEHDRAHANDGPRHLLSQEDQLLQGARLALEKLSLDDRAPDSPVARQSKTLEALQRQQQSDQRRLTTFEYHLEQSMALFRRSFAGPEAAYAAFRKQAREKGLKHAQNELSHRASQFGDMAREIDAAALDEIAASLRSVHYTEKKIFAVRLRIDDALLQPEAMERALASHGITGPRWQHRAAARAHNLSGRIRAAEERLWRARDNPDGRRLLLMATVRDAGARLDRDTFERLGADEKDAIRTVCGCLERPENAKRLKALKQRAQVKRPERDDPRRRQYYQG